MGEACTLKVHETGDSSPTRATYLVNKIMWTVATKTEIFSRKLEQSVWQWSEQPAYLGHF